MYKRAKERDAPFTLLQVSCRTRTFHLMACAISADDARHREVRRALERGEIDSVVVVAMRARESRHAVKRSEMVLVGGLRDDVPNAIVQAGINLVRRHILASQTEVGVHREKDTIKPATQGG